MSTPSAPAGHSRNFTDRLPSLAEVGPLIALVLACAFFISQSDRFLSFQNLSLILQQTMVVAVIAIGQTLIVLTGGIDLSCGMVMAFGSIIMTKFAVTLGVPPVLAIVCGVAASALFGALNGVLITRIKLPRVHRYIGHVEYRLRAHADLFERPRACRICRTRSCSSATPSSSAPRMSRTAPSSRCSCTWPPGSCCATRCPAGICTRSGNNAEAARLMGLSSQKILLTVYSLAGAIYGIAALLSVSRTGVGDPQAGQTENLDSITAVVLGGTSLFGGRGSIVGTLLGALIVGVFRNGLTLIGVSSVYQVLITGMLVILAVAADKLSHRRG